MQQIKFLSIALALAMIAPQLNAAEEALEQDMQSLHDTNSAQLKQTRDQYFKPRSSFEADRFFNAPNSRFYAGKYTPRSSFLDSARSSSPDLTTRFSPTSPTSQRLAAHNSILETVSTQDLLNELKARLQQGPDKEWRNL